MRLIKMLGLAMVAAIAAMAFVGAGTAMAEDTEVTLCKVEEKLCSEANEYPANTLLLGESLGKPKFTGGSLTVECEHSHFLAKTLDQMSEHLRLDFELLTFTGTCTGCEKAEITTLPTGTILVATGDVYSLHIGSKVLAVLKNCLGLGIECRYEASTGELSLANTSGSVLALASGVSLTRDGGSGFCPSAGTWTSHYVNILVVKSDGGTGENGWLALELLGM